MPIIPDDKDWTWVLERPCPECGFDPSTVDARAVADGLRSVAAEWPALLAHPAATSRPTDSQWSALEYACHVRDAFRIFDERLARMLREADPTFANWDQDETALAERYAEQDPSVVATELLDAARAVAARFDAVDSTEWNRTGGRSDGARFTVESLGRYLLHDPLHHVWDVARGYESTGASASAV